MGKFVDLTGNKYGRLTVIKRIETDRGERVKWLCQCDCGNLHTTVSYSLTHGLCQSCGCINQSAEYRRSNNYYDLSGNYGIGFTAKNEAFYFDLEDYDIIKNIGWSCNSQGYIIGNITINGKQRHIGLHRLIMGSPEKMMVDHINGNKLDNRKSNLRICNNKENTRNSSVQKRNKLSAKGVSITHSNTYQAQIQVDGKLKYLGSYKTIKEAADAYDLAAQKYFGEFARLNNYVESSTKHTP